MTEMSAPANIIHSVKAVHIVDSAGDLPTTFNSAVESSNAVNWKETCDSEMNPLRYKRTWDHKPFESDLKQWATDGFFGCKRPTMNNSSD